MTRTVDDVIEAVRGAASLEPVGARTHAEVANPVRSGAVEIRAPAGIVAHDPADLTVTALAGTTFDALDAQLAAHGQFVPLDPRDRAATIGGTLATGLSGVRRLGYGPLRDTVLEVRFVSGYGEVVKGGGPTVKNVTGYDLPRLLVGSLGSLGVIVQATLRCRPRPVVSTWITTPRRPTDVAERLLRPKAVLFDTRSTFVLLEGDAADVAAERANAGLDDVEARQVEPNDVEPRDVEPPSLPKGPHRGRVSVPIARLEACAAELGALGRGLTWLAEWGVGTVHVAADDVAAVLAARRIAETHGGWLLREAGLAGVDGFGVSIPNARLHGRVKDALDPLGKLAPGRFEMGAVA